MHQIAKPISIDSSETLDFPLSHSNSHELNKVGQDKREISPL